MEKNYTDFNLKTLLRQTIDSFENQVSRNNNKLKLIMEAELPEILHGDSGRLSQILSSLIGNAVKFTQNGQIKVLVEHFGGGREAETLEFAVQDTGKGIPEEKLVKLFDHIGIAPNYNGISLSLPVCKQLIELQGGTFKVESQLHKGSTFRFTLPFPAKKVIFEKVTAATRPDRFSPAILSEENTVNLNYLHELAGGNTGFIAEIITLFLQQTPQNVKDLALYAQEKDWDNLKKLAHKMRSAVALMGMASLQYLLVNLETYITKQVNLELIPTMITEVTQICQKAVIELQVKQSQLELKAFTY